MHINQALSCCNLLNVVMLLLAAVLYTTNVFQSTLLLHSCR